MTHLGLFEGIGGFSLSARWMGWETLAWCEWNEFCQKVLRYHFPDAEGFGDITKTDFTKYANRIDVLTGGFPCQPYSQAGKRKGKEDDRHLWPEMLRAAKQIQPRWIVGENVPGIVNWSKGMVVNEIKTNLEDEGFTLLPPIIIPACSQDAPHRRDRVWFIAHSNNTGKSAYGNNIDEIRSEEIKETEFAQFEFGGLDTLQRVATHTNGIIGLERRTKKQVQGQSDLLRFEFERSFESFRRRWDISAPRTCGVNDGIPDRMDRIKSLGNAIVPQVAYQIFKTIQEYEELLKK